MLAFVKFQITFFISMYITCVRFCLFSALSHSVGALEISIIIICCIYMLTVSLNSISKNKCNVFMCVGFVIGLHV